MAQYTDRWTGLAAGLAVLTLWLVVASVRLPYVIWSPGPLTDLFSPDTGVQITAPLATYPTTGHLLVAGVDVTGKGVTLGQAIGAYYGANQEVLPQDINFPVGSPIAQLAVVQGAQDSEDSQTAAEVAALRLAGVTVQPVTRVSAVMVAGASNGRLLPGDVIDSVGSTTVTSVADFKQALATHTVGETIQLTVTRDGVQLTAPIDVVAQASNASNVANTSPTPSIGVTMIDTFQMAGFEVKSAPKDTGAGLLLAVAVYDAVTSGVLLGDMSVAGAGAVDATGAVSPVAGASERLQAAQQGGAKVFLLPSGNCNSVASAGPAMIVVAVSTLSQAVADLRTLARGGSAGDVTTCRV